jgi:hypothetical protein
VEIGAYKKETAQLILDTVKYLRESGFIIERPGRGQQKFRPADAPTYVRNDTGETIPPFACLQVTGTVEAGGQNYITVDKPVDDTGEAGKYLFNGIAPIEIGGYGIAHDGPVVRMLTEGTTVTCGDMWQPDIGEFAVIPGGSMFSAVGEDDIETDVMRAFILGGGGGSGSKIFFEVDSAAIAGTSSPYNGKMILTVTIILAPCDQPSLIDTTVDVVDWSTCLANAETTLAVVGREGWAFRGIGHSLKSGDPSGTLTPCHWALDGLCCPP